MSQSRRPRNAEREEGFTLIEVMVALAILLIGMMATALLMTNVYQQTVRSRYIATAAQLASEKLEDLNRFPVASSNGVVTYIDPHILVPVGSNTCGAAGVTCIGSLATDWGPQTITDLSGHTTPISYYDSICLSILNGTMSETYQMAGGGSPSYATVQYSPNGKTPTVTNSTTPPTVGMTFDRRWVIEQDQPLAGVRRITVLVTLRDLTIQPPVTFQMSLVRP